MNTKLTAVAIALLCLVPALRAQESNEKVITGLNFGPLPAVAYDSDKGFQLGALLNIFNYGDGSDYPYYKDKWYLGAYYFTKGSQAYDLMYDKFDIFPGVRLAASAKFELDKSYDFYGFNGYNAFYDYDRIKAGEDGSDYLFHPFYRRSLMNILVRGDFIGDFRILDNALGWNLPSSLHWTAGYHFKYTKTSAIDINSINKGKSDNEAYPDVPTLYDYYRAWGIIPDDQANGGIVSAIRAGLEFDSRDQEGAPSKGIWADAHLILAPSWLGTTTGYAGYVVNWRQYIPIIDRNTLTFAYRVNYQGTLGNTAPFYALNYLSVLGSDNDVEGMGGYKTTRGIMRSRVVGLDTALWTAELRWRFLRFPFIGQNFALALNAFTDGSVVTRELNTAYNPTATSDAKLAALGAASKPLYDKFVLDTSDAPHITFGAGLRVIMNENFIVAFEYGKPLSSMNKNSSHYMQDGTGAMYINMGYLF